MNEKVPVWLAESCDGQSLALVQNSVFRCLSEPHIIRVPTAREHFIGVIDWQNELIPVFVGPTQAPDIAAVLLLFCTDPALLKGQCSWLGLAISALPKKREVEGSLIPFEASLVDETGSFWWQRAMSYCQHGGRSLPLVMPDKLLI